jgi:glyoxylase-like metal-dependent hydrolase (beta-lactamase superfamily II)
MINAKVPDGRWPTETFSSTTKQFYLNGEAITLVHHSGISDGDSLVVFRGSNVVATGEVFSPRRYPRIDVAAGGSIDGVIEALDMILVASAPTAARPEPVVIIPGRGPLSDRSGVVEYRTVMTIIRGRIRDMATEGMTLAAVKAARPTSEFDPIYATQAHPGEMFTERVYRSLTRLR